MSALGLILCLAILAIFPSPAATETNRSSNPQLEDASFSPTPGQVDLELHDVASFVDDNSLVRRRDFFSHRIHDLRNRDSALYFGHDLGVRTLQMPELQATYWFDGINAVQFQFRYFGLYGSRFASQPVVFNGDLIAPGQNLSTSGTTWFTGGLFYERRITPWLYEHVAPSSPYLQNWDIRPKIGVEFVYLDFQISNGHPKSISGSLDARGRFHDQELPIPTIGVEARHWLNEKFLFEVTAQGNWINKWNSLRNETGTVYLSQSSFETHGRVAYYDLALRGVRPYLGVNYYYYKQAETSGQISNLIRLQTYGPEIGLSYNFQTRAGSR
jgi:hypothetical protein